MRASRLIKMNGYVGLITTSSISEGDTREVCLEKLLLEGNSIYRAASSQTWPGTASVTYSAIWYSPCRWHGNYFLNNEQVVKINAYLKDEVDIEEKPLPLLANSESSYQGSVILGKGFILTKVEADTLISKNKNNEQVIWPYLIGEEVNSSPTHSHTHWVINFWNWPLSRSTAPGDYFGPVAEDFPDCLKIIREKVKPQRDKDNRKVRRERWWQFGELATGLYLAIKGKGKVLAIAKQATKYVAFGFVPEGTVFSHALAIITRNDYASFAVLSSNFHEVWSRAYASYNLALLRYSPSDLYETFPFPIQNINELEAIGKEYSENRSNIMLKANEGLTDIYNRFNSPKEINGQIIQLRELHVKMDDAVSAAYGWSDLELGHGFHKTPQGVRFTISEAARREVLARLLRLNHERYEEEVKQGLHDKGLKGKEKNIKSKNKNKGRVIQEDPDQYKLF